MGKPKITIAGIGPGSPEDITPAVVEAIREADVVVGYKYYFQFIEPYLKADCPCIDTGMRRERDRARQAFELAMQGSLWWSFPAEMQGFTAWLRWSMRWRRKESLR